MVRKVWKCAKKDKKKDEHRLRRLYVFWQITRNEAVSRSRSSFIQ